MDDAPLATSASAARTVPRRSQQERRSEAEQKLLLAARDIVARKGASGMTLAEVGERAGYSRGLAAHHFGSKAGLMRALANYINQSFMAEVAAATPRRPGLDSVLGFVSVYLSRKGGNWINTRALLVLMAEAMLEHSGTGKSLAEYNRTVLDYLEQHLKIGIKAGEVRRTLAPDATAVLVLGALRGIMLQRLMQGGDVDPVAARDQLLDFLQRAVAK